MPDDLSRRHQTDSYKAMSLRSDRPSATAQPTQVKQHWVAEGKVMTAGLVTPKPQRLPTDQHLVNYFPFVCLSTRHHVAPLDWSLKVGGPVHQPLHWNWNAFPLRPQEKHVNDLHNIKFWQRFENVWSGVPKRHGLAAATRPWL